MTPNMNWKEVATLFNKVLFKDDRPEFVMLIRTLKPAFDKAEDYCDLIDACRNEYKINYVFEFTNVRKYRDDQIHDFIDHNIRLIYKWCHNGYGKLCSCDIVSFKDLFPNAKMKRDLEMIHSRLRIFGLSFMRDIDPADWKKIRVLAVTIPYEREEGKFENSIKYTYLENRLE